VTPSQVRLAVAHGSPMFSGDVRIAAGGDPEAERILRAQCERIAFLRAGGHYEMALREALQPVRPAAGLLEEGTT
jgi:hypothetical protein